MASVDEYGYITLDENTDTSTSAKQISSRHNDRSTWETQGGHIEENETPLEAAKRELFEESGAIEYSIAPVCDYWSGTEDMSHGANGMVFKAINLEQFQRVR